MTQSEVCSLPKPYYQDDAVTIYHGDCREVLPELDPVDLVLTDPPWGTATNCDSSRFSPPATGWWRNADRSLQRHNYCSRMKGDSEPFDPVHLLTVGKAHIIWGGHSFANRLPPSPGWLVWDKRKGIEDCTWPMSEAELAWTDIGKGIHVFRHRWMGLVRETEQGQHHHPTQKPVSLMIWCLERWKGLVLDPYMGSGTTLRAAKDLGRKAIGIEIEERYCEIAAQRMAQEALL